MSFSVRQAFESFHLPVLRSEGAAASTLTTYRCAIAAWEQFGPDVSVDQIRQSHLLEFKANLVAAGRAPATFDGYWRAIRAILSSCVVEDVLREMPRTPRIKPTRASEKPRPTPEQVVALLEWCHVAKWPEGQVPAPDVWRALIGVAYFTCLRRGDLLGTGGLTWDAVRADGIGWEPNKTRRHGKWVFCPNVQGVLTRLLAPLRGHGGRWVFGMVPLNLAKLAETQHRIATWAGVEPQLATFHPLRRAGLDAWLEADETAAGLISGHGVTLPTVTRRHYVSQDAERARIERVMKRAAQAYQLPGGLRPRRESA